MKIMWTNKLSKEQGYVRVVHKDKGYFENTFDIKEAKNFQKRTVSATIAFLNECCKDNEYTEVVT